MCKDKTDDREGVKMKKLINAVSRDEYLSSVRPFHSEELRTFHRPTRLLNSNEDNDSEVGLPVQIFNLFFFFLILLQIPVA